ncbi:MAG: hypothetical protein UIC63_01065, partial [Bacteroidaceae bacterium]|nr:hypothetical protein [Bacteroidaceae bacterium]
FLLRPASDQALEIFQKQSLAPDVVSTTIPNPGRERGEPSKMFFNLHPVWTSSKKATDTKEGGRCRVVLPRYRVV